MSVSKTLPVVQSVEDLLRLNTKRKLRWGNWMLKGNRTLEHRIKGSTFVRYYIDLDRMQTSAECLDWIFQIHRKSWITDQDRADLLHAIQDIINPQAALCSGGVEHGKS